MPRRHRAGASRPFDRATGHLAVMGIDCALFGPGSIDVAHRPNEFIPIDEFEQAKGLLRSLVQQMCVD